MYVLFYALDRKCKCPHFHFSDIEYAKNYAKMAESAKMLASQQVTEQFSLWKNVNHLKPVASCLY